MKASGLNIESVEIVSLNLFSSGENSESFFGLIREEEVPREVLMDLECVLSILRESLLVCLFSIHQLIRVFLEKTDL